jgi:hypothetical protein
MSKLQRAKKLLETNEEASAVHFTSDGMPFFNEAQAKGHGSRLPDRTVTTITRGEAEAEEVATEQLTAEKPAKPLDKMNKAELTAEIAKRPGLSVEPTATNKQMAAVIEAFDLQAAVAQDPDLTDEQKGALATEVAEA